MSIYRESTTYFFWRHFLGAGNVRCTIVRKQHHVEFHAPYVHWIDGIYREIRFATSQYPAIERTGEMISNNVIELTSNTQKPWADWPSVSMQYDQGSYYVPNMENGPIVLKKDVEGPHYLDRFKKEFDPAVDVHEFQRGVNDFKRDNDPDPQGFAWQQNAYWRGWKYASKQEGSFYGFDASASVM